MHDSIGDEFAGQDDRVVDDVGEAPALEGVADEGSGGRDRSPDGIETGGRARGDHSTPCPVVGVRGPVADPLLSGQCLVPRRPRILGLSPRMQSGGHGAVPLRCLPARSCATAQAGQTGVAGQPHARLLTFAVHADAGHRCFRRERGRVSVRTGACVSVLTRLCPPPGGVRTMCEAAELLWPGSAGVKHWASSSEKVGQAECLPVRRASST